MNEPIPKFDAPPVVETVLSIQFEQVPNFTGAVAGWFWQFYLAKNSGNWPKTLEVPALEDQAEKFGDEQVWSAPGVRLSPMTRPQRIQIIREDDERMVQIQDSRLILNWKKKSGDYPSYDVIFPEFKNILDSFQKFLKDGGFPDLVFNQWEVTYVNHILWGDLWKSPTDWVNIIPCMAVPNIDTSIIEAESANMSWKFIIGDRLGRLYANVRHVKLPPDNEEAIRLEYTARGSIDRDIGNVNIKDYFDIGHDTIVKTFANMTSPEAHEIWKRTQ